MLKGKIVLGIVWNFKMKKAQSKWTESHKVIQRTMALEDVRQSTKREMQSRLSRIIDEVVDSLQRIEFPPERAFMTSDSTIMKDKTRRGSNPEKLPEKEFRSRPSPLTDLLEVPHIATINHIFIAALCLIMVHNILSDIIEDHTVDLGLERLLSAFDKPSTTLKILVSMEILALFTLYPAFFYWSSLRLGFQAEARRIVDVGATACFAVFMVGFVYFPANRLLHDPLGPASGALVTMEQCRLLMKMYAFVRTNVRRALVFDERDGMKTTEGDKNSCFSGNGREDENENESKGCDDDSAEVRRRVKNVVNKSGGLDVDDDNNGVTKTATTSGLENGRSSSVSERKLLRRESWLSWNDEKSPCPSYSRYLYFYFAPTLIYKDSYPRTSSIRWNYVCWNFAQVFGCIFYANMVVGKACHLYFHNFGLPGHSMTPALLCNAIFSLMLPGIVGLILGFYLLLHSWHNAFAELLKFGDRLFYKDWWNRSSFSDYYKTWNVLVHDWLYTYVFKDAWESGLGRKHKALPTTLVFLLSSVFHEYILAFSLNFFLPVLFVLFGGFGFALVFVKSIRGPVGNVFMWLGLMSGTGMILSAYSMEYFARINCPQSSEKVILGFLHSPITVMQGCVYMALRRLSFMFLSPDSITYQDP